jgi:glycopeptide antibiotics resistance protein
LRFGSNSGILGGASLSGDVMQKRLISALVLMAYAAILVKVVVFKGLPHKHPPAPPPVPTRHVIIRWGTNFVPFKTILPQLRGEPRWSTALINLAANTVLFVPVGLLVSLIHRKITWQKSLAVAVAVGVAMEGMEWILNTGVVDVDDVILNAFGVMIGYWVFTFFEGRRGTSAASAHP